MNERDIEKLGERTMIARVSSRHRHSRRWTEIEVHFIHAPTPQAGNKRWASIVRGCSSIEGETTRVRVSVRSTLENALRLISPTDVGEAARTQAREWFRANAGRIRHEQQA